MSPRATSFLRSAGRTMDPLIEAWTDGAPGMVSISAAAAAPGAGGGAPGGADGGATGGGGGAPGGAAGGAGGGGAGGAGGGGGGGAVSAETPEGAIPAGLSARSFFSQAKQPKASALTPSRNRYLGLSAVDIGEKYHGCHRFFSLQPRPSPRVPGHIPRAVYPV